VTADTPRSKTIFTATQTIWIQESSLTKITENGDTRLPHYYYSKHYVTNSKEEISKSNAQIEQIPWVQRAKREGFSFVPSLMPILGQFTMAFAQQRIYLTPHKSLICVVMVYLIFSSLILTDFLIISPLSEIAGRVEFTRNRFLWK
jgi:hypothetical protein